MFSRKFSLSRPLQMALSILLTIVVIGQSNAQSPANNLFGDKDQPGNRLHQKIVAKVDSGTPEDEAILSSIDSALTNYDNTVSGEAKSVIAFDVPIANEFYSEMLNMNSLIDVTKVLVETHPPKAVHIITLGVVLYPDYAQEVYEGASLTGLMDADDVLIAAIQAGADPSSISAATAAGPAAPSSALPLGGGIGAGGTGGGDTTASTN